MTVENANTIDFITINDNGEVVLTISDHLDWVNDKEHLRILQLKLNRYLFFIEEGELYSRYTQCAGRKCVISLVMLNKPTPEAESFLKRAGDVIQKSGIGFKYTQRHYNSPL